MSDTDTDTDTDTGTVADRAFAQEIGTCWGMGVAQRDRTCLRLPPDPVGPVSSTRSVRRST